MRVRIAYGVKMEDVPSKVRGLIEEAGMSLDEKLMTIKMLVSLADKEGGMAIAANHIDQIRRSLADLDTVLADAHAIAEGYVGYLSPQEQPAEPQSEVSNVTENPPDVREG
jgi:hypothetical protein